MSSDGVGESILARLAALEAVNWQEQNTVTLGELADLAEPDYRAELAEFIAQVRYRLDDMKGVTNDHQFFSMFDALVEFVGPWPHEVKP